MAYDGTIEQYLTKMSKDGTWGGHIELQALSRVLKRNISVYNDSKEHIVIEVSHPVDPNPICIAYDRSKLHYSSLKLSKKKSQEPQIKDLKNLRIILFN